MTRSRTAALTAALIATLGLSACGADDDPVAAQPATVPPSTTPDDDVEVDDDGGSRTITVSGTGTVDVVPDIANLSLGVQVSAETSQQAIDRLGTESEELLTALTGLGIAERDIQTAGLDLYPQYDQNGQQINGYQASTSVNVTARDLDGLGGLIDGVSALVRESLTLGGISFSYDDPESVLGDARRAAVEDAETKAAQYADVAGATVGPIIRIVEGQGFGGEIFASASEMSFDEAAADVAIEPGQQELTVDVTVVFEME